MRSARTAPINVMNSVEFVQISVTDSVKIRADQRDGSSKIRADQRDGFSKIHADQGDEFGFYSRRRTCKCQEETGETKSASRRNRFLALTAIESDSARGSGGHVGLWSGQGRLAESKERCRENEVEGGGETGGGERKSHSS